ncbi:MAG: chorismate-binding protein, partial [Deltaproteobacteria bacterium]
MLIEECSAKPLDVFNKIYAQPFAFFLDSCGANRYSLLGIDPLILIKAQNNKVEVTGCCGAKITTDDVFSTVNSIFNKFKKTKKRLPFPFPFHGGGMAGYFGYDLKNQLEDLSKKRAVLPVIPDCILGVYDTIFVYDCKINKGYCVSAGLTSDGREEKLLAKERISRLLDIISADDSQRILPSQAITYKDNIESNFTKTGYIDAIRIIQGYIASGDIYQANLSQRFIVNYKGNPAALYNALRRINPVPFGAFLNYGDFQIISNSPERLLKIK